MRFIAVVLAAGCASDEDAWLSQLAEVGFGPAGPALGDMVVRADGRVLVAAQVDPEARIDLVLESSDPGVIDVAELAPGAFAWEAVESGEADPVGVGAVARHEEADGTWISVELQSGGPGVAELWWVDPDTDDIVDVVAVEVAEPAGVQLAPQNAAGWDALAIAPGPIHLLEGRDYALRATELARDGRPLSGGGGPVTATSGAAGDGWVWVAPEDVVALDLRPARAEDRTGLLLVGVDRAGHDVFGVPAAFSGAEGQGDFFEYAEAPFGPEVEVVATWDGLEVAATIRTENPGAVKTSDAAGASCAVTGAAPLRMLWTLAVLAIALRRRR